MLVIITITLIVLYGVFVTWMIFHWPTHPSKLPPSNPVYFSVIVPFRNEEYALPLTLLALSKVNHPHPWELILVDDHSDDSSYSIAQNWASNQSHVRVLQAHSIGKKAALAQGIAKSSGQWIITLDADTSVQSGWLSSISGALACHSQAEVIVLPVVNKSHGDAFGGLFALEFLSLVATGLCTTSGGMPIMSNGANFAFTRKIYDAVGGYESHSEISSGDDLFLLMEAHDLQPQKVVAWCEPKSVVETESPTRFSEWWTQRLRWGGKAKAYSSKNIIAVTVLVFAVNFWFITLGICLIMELIGPNVFFIYAACKFVFEAYFAFITTRNLGKMELFKWMPLLYLVYPFLLVSTAIGSLFSKGEWKGRPVVS